MSAGKVSPAEASQAPLWVHRFAVITSISTLLLIFVGGLVTSTGSGLAVPDWPLSFGQVFPPMVGGVLYEHGHRMAASLVGMLTVTLVVFLSKWEPRAWVRWLSRGALAAVILQGLLGGLTVLLRLPTAVSVSHACLAQIFFCLTVTIAVCTSPGWESRRGVLAENATPSIHTLVRLQIGLIFLQLIIGAFMRHTGAGLAIPDFPLAFGRVVPPFTSQGVVVHFMHRVGAVVVSVAIIWTITRIATTFWHERALRSPAIALAILLLSQLSLGALTIWTQRAVVPMTAHVAVGAAVLATSVLLALRVYQLVALAHRPSQHLVSEQVTA